PSLVKVFELRTKIVAPATNGLSGSRIRLIDGRASGVKVGAGNARGTGRLIGSSAVTPPTELISRAPPSLRSGSLKTRLWAVLMKVGSTRIRPVGWASAVPPR